MRFIGRDGGRFSAGVVIALFAVLFGCADDRHAKWTVPLSGGKGYIEVTGYSRGSDSGYLGVVLKRQDGSIADSIRTDAGGEITRIVVFAPPNPSEYWVMISALYGQHVLLRVGPERVTHSSSEALQRSMGELYPRVRNWEACKCADGQRLEVSLPVCLTERPRSIFAPWSIELVTGPPPPDLAGVVP
jgi:hypothetical protein